LSKSEKPPALLLAIRTKGTVNVRKDMRSTLDSLRLRRVHSATLLKAEASALGALQAVKDLIVWGEIEEDTLAKLLEKRARLVGDRPITVDYLKQRLKVKGFSDLAESMMSSNVKLSDLSGLRPFFRLSPPRKGYHVVRQLSRRGKTQVAGYIGKAINDLALRMI